MSVRQISSDTLLNEGYDVYKSATENYLIKAKLPSKMEFEDRVNRSEENEFWGCFDNETHKLVAFSMNSVTSSSLPFISNHLMSFIFIYLISFFRLFPSTSVYIISQSYTFVNPFTQISQKNSKIHPSEPM